MYGVRATLISNQWAENKWGQSNINFQSKGAETKGG
jgi:hypothetical protein